MKIGDKIVALSYIEDRDPCFNEDCCDDIHLHWNVDKGHTGTIVKIDPETGFVNVKWDGVVGSGWVNVSWIGLA